jgi:hypothetical protein
MGESTLTEKGNEMGLASYTYNKYSIIIQETPDGTEFEVMDFSSLLNPEGVLCYTGISKKDAEEWIDETDYIDNEL